MRDPNASAGTVGGPISKNFAFVVLGALILLLIMRHLFGSVTISGGVH